MAIEIVSFPIRNGDFPVRYVNVYQRVPIQIAHKVSNQHWIVQNHAELYSISRNTQSPVGFSSLHRISSKYDNLSPWGQSSPRISGPGAAAMGGGTEEQITYMETPAHHCLLRKAKNNSKTVGLRRSWISYHVMFFWVKMCFFSKFWGKPSYVQSQSPNFFGLTSSGEPWAACCRTYSNAKMGFDLGDHRSQLGEAGNWTETGGYNVWNG